MSTFPAWQCDECAALFGHEPVVCRECGADSVAEHPIDGGGTVYASTVIRVPGSDEASEDPFEVCLVDVGEGPTVRVTGRIQGVADLSPGDEVVFVDHTDDTYVFEAGA